MSFKSPFGKIYWPLVVTFLLFSMAIGLAGYFFYQNQKRVLKQKAWDELGAIADLKVREIATWRKERIGDGSVIFNNPFTSQEFRKYLTRPGVAVVRQEFLNWIRSLKEYLQYDSVLLLDKGGTVQFSVPNDQDQIGAMTRSQALEAMQKKGVVFSDLYRSDETNQIRMSLFIPLLVPKEEDLSTVGVLLLRIDPYQYLYPLIQSWPTPSRSSETLLIRHEGDDVVYLNELRHRKNTALALRLPINQSRLPAAMALRGKEGFVEGFDYRGTPVLAVMRKIPDSPWVLVSKVDQEEIYGPIRQQAWFTAVLSGLLIAGAGLSVAFFWRGEHLREHKRIRELLIKTNAELEERVGERTAQLRAINESLQREIMERTKKEEALKESETQLRVLSSRLLRAQEEERKRIAGELHDSIGGTLNAIRFKIEKALNPSDPDVVTPEILKVLLPLVQQAIEESRRMMADLRPSMLDDLGIIATLGWLSRQFGAIYSGIQIEQRIEVKEEAIPEPLKIVIFRIVQEALNNIAKHSEADRVILWLRETNSSIELVVQDNGQGFDPGEAISERRPAGGLGLTSMRERAELSGGAFVIESSGKDGTVIRASWPIEQWSLQPPDPS